MYRIQVKNQNDEWADLDVNPTEKVAMTYDSKNIGEIAVNNGWSSSTFNLPASANNRKLLGFPHYFNAAQNNAWRKNPCLLFVDGHEITGGGAYLQINKTQRNGNNIIYNCIIYSGIQEFAEALKAKQLRDLKFTNPDFKVANIVAAYSGDADVVFPVMDWIDNANESGLIANKVNINHLMPFVYVRNVIDKICKAANFDLITDLEDSTAKKQIYNKLALNAVGRSSVQDTSSMTFPVAVMNIGKGEITFEQNNDGCMLKGYFDCRYDGYYKFETITNIDDNNNENNFYIKAVKSANDYYFIYQGAHEVKLKAGGYNFYLCGKGTIKVEQMTVNCIGYRTAGESVGVGEAYPIGENLPAITQWDMFKEFLNFFGLSCMVNYNTRRVYAYTLDRIYKNIENALDWTDKLDYRTEEHNFDMGYAQLNHIKYKENKYKNTAGHEVKVTSIGEFKPFSKNTAGETEVQNTLNPQAKNVYEFKAFALRNTLLQGVSVAKHNWINPADGKPGGDAPMLFALLNKAELESGLIFTNGNDEQNMKDVVFVTYASFAGIEGEDVVNVFYNKLTKQMLNRQRKLTVKMWLTPNDVTNFNHFTPVYLAAYGMCFYVQKIDKFKAGSLTTVELVAML